MTKRKIFILFFSLLTSVTILIVRNSQVWAAGKLELYKIPQNLLLPHFYIPKNILYLQGELSDLEKVFSLSGWEVRSGVYISENTPSIKNFIKNFDDVDSMIVVGQCLYCDPLRGEELRLPSVRFLPGSLPYPLIRWKEKRWETTVRNLGDPIQTVYLDLGLASKRLAEIDKLIREKKTQTVIEKTGNEYWSRMVDFSRWLQESEKKDKDLTGKYYRQIASYLRHHKNVLKNLLAEELNDETKVLFKTIFWKLDDFLTKIENKQKEAEKAKRYHLDLLKGGSYELLVKQEAVESYFIKNPFNPLSFALDEKLATKQGELQNNSWLKMGNYDLERGRHKLAVFLPKAKNLVEKENLLLELKEEGKKTVALPINNFNNHDLYKISFTYRAVEGGRIRFLVAQDTDKEEMGRAKYAVDTDLLRDPLPLTFEALFEPDTGAKEAHLEFWLRSEGEDGNIFAIENLKVERIWNPTVILRYIKTNLGNKDIPKISFRKINPTKYKIKVEGAKRPYTLIFSENFNNGWKAYIDQTQNSKLKTQNGDIIASYFDGEIKEGTHKNIFLDKDTFEIWRKKPIPEDRHLLVNGYANSWYITPEDAEGAENYEIIIEFWPQRLFYIGIIVSALSLLSCLGYLGWSLLKEKKL